ncbi:MAG: hypothetical protein QNJ54_34470 [Prochloraceae cyanobacterium]|nr:hypothetical protein [Prochloraceae cyanobacterium]
MITIKLPIISLLTAATLGILVNLSSYPVAAATRDEENKYQDFFTEIEQLPKHLKEQIIIVFILITPLGISLCLSQISPLMESPVIKVKSTQSSRFETQKKTK